nr:gypsy/Ty3 retroelement polyprotein [Tanacetum cinerariifolium]
MRFVRHYALISKPLTRILKKNAFEWDEVAHIALTELKQVMTQAPVLALLNFQKTFVVEIDASSLGIGAVLQQEGYPIAYLSKILSPKHQSLSIYENDFFDVLLPLKKWKGAELNSLALCTIASDLLQKIKDSYEQDSAAEEKIQLLTNVTYTGDKYTRDGFVLTRKGK